MEKVDKSDLIFETRRHLAGARIDYGKLLKKLKKTAETANRYALYGGFGLGIGGVAGYLISRKKEQRKNMLRNILLGSFIGSGLGLLGGEVYRRVNKLPSLFAGPTKSDEDPYWEAIQNEQSVLRKELASCGVTLPEDTNPRDAVLSSYDPYR